MERLRNKSRMGCEFIDVEQDLSKDCVLAIYRDHMRSNRLERIEGDFLLCTIPFSVLSQLPAHRRFSLEKQMAIRDLRYVSCIKTLIPTRARFWETRHRIFGGASYTDLIAGTIYYPS